MSPARGRYCVGSEPVPGYVLTEFLGRGQFGDVWKATGPGKNDVALKIIDLTGGEGSRELAALQQIKSVHHPNLMPIFASWLKDAKGGIVDDQTTSAATELVVAMGLGAKSLFQRLAECTQEGTPGIPLDELLDYMEGAARGIDYLNQPIHDLGHGPVPIIHGDIKPHNLLIVGNAVQICDFGLARAVENLRMTQTALGTCAYASAELLYGKPHWASDQYCLAISYIELRTGALPFDETNPFQVADRHREGKLDFSRLPPGEREVIQRATALVPDERWPSCRDMVRALRRAARPEEEQPAAPPRQDTRPTTQESDLVRPVPVDRQSEVHPATPSSSSVQGTLLPPSPKAAGQRSTDSSQLSTRTLEFRPSSTMPAVERPSRRRRVAKVCAALVLVVGLGIGADVFFRVGVSQGIVARLTGLFDGGTEPLPDGDEIDLGQTTSGDGQSSKSGQQGSDSGTTVVESPPPPPPQWDAATFDRLIKDCKFGDAVTMLDKSPPGLLDAGQKAALDDQIVTAWSADLKPRWQKQEWQEVRESCAALLARWPQRAEERVLRCRAEVRLGDIGEALKELEAIEPVPESLRPLCLALELVAEYGTSSIVAEQPEKVADRLLALDAAVLAGQPSFWSPDAEELKQIDKIRADVAKTLLKAIRRQLSPEQLNQAKQSLEKVDGLLGDKSDNAEVARWQVVIHAIDACRRKDAAADEVRAALDALAKLVPGGAWPEDVDAAVIGEIAAALGDVAGKAHAPSELAAELDTALVLAGAAWRANRLDDRVATSLRRLWEKRVETYVVGAQPVTKEAFSRFEADWRVFEQAEQRSSLVDAWRAECLMELDRPGEVPRDLPEPKPNELSEPMAAYVRYVRARALEIAAQGGLLDDAVAELARAMEGGSFPPETLKARGRLDHVAALVVEASKRRRALEGTYQKLNDPPRNPFLQKSGYYAVLRRLAGLKWDALAADKQHEITVGLVLAGWGDAKADVARARSAAAEVLQLADADLAPDPVPALYACVASYLTPVATAPLSDDDRRNAVAGCARLLAVLRDREACSGTLTDEYAATLYRQVIQPVLLMAQGLEKAGDGAVVAEALWSGVGQLIWDHRYAKWPVDNEEKEIEGLFSRAIAACEKRGAAADKNRLAEYYVQRGRARIESPSADRELVVADATAALAKADLFGARGLLAHAYLSRSRGQARDADRLKDLDRSVESGEQAVAKCPPKDRSLPNYLVNLSCAYLERANYSHASERRADDLKRAVESAERAKSSAQGNPDFPYLALGNAYEDLAWIVREKPEENYPKAIRAFKDASQKQHFPAAALCSLARCYYKMVVDGGLDPAILGDPKLTTAAQVLDECAQLLESAVQLRPDLVEACYYLGRVHLSRKQYAQADRWFEAAKTQAGKQKSLDCVGYAEQWARFPLANADLKPDEQYQQALSRAEQIATMDVPPILSASLKRAVAGIRGEMLQRKESFNEAVAAYDEALPKDLSQAQEQDVRLLLARARANLQLLKGQFKPTTLEAVVRDAGRAAALAVSPMEKATAQLSTAGAYCVAYCQNVDAHLDPFVASLSEAVSLCPSGPVGLGCRKEAVAMLIVAVTSPRGEKTPKAIAEKQRLLALIVPWQSEVVAMSENPSEKSDARTLLEKAETLLTNISSEGVDHLVNKAQDIQKDATVTLSADEKRLLQQCLPWQKTRFQGAQPQEKEAEKNNLGWLEYLQGKAKP